MNSHSAKIDMARRLEMLDNCQTKLDKVKLLYQWTTEPFNSVLPSEGSYHIGVKAFAKLFERIEYPKHYK